MSDPFDTIRRSEELAMEAAGFESAGNATNNEEWLSDATTLKEAAGDQAFVETFKVPMLPGEDTLDYVKRAMDLNKEDK